MRVPLLALGLLSTFFVRAAAQSQAAVKDSTQCVVADEHRSPRSFNHDQDSDHNRASDHDGDFDRDRRSDHDRRGDRHDGRRGCSPVTPPQPPPPPPPPPPPTNTGTITGSVHDASTGLGLSGWVVMAIGPTTVTATTDANGNYVLNVPAATYIVCEQVQAGWQQVYPMFPEPCPTGFGYNQPVDANLTSPFVNFQNQAL